MKRRCRTGCLTCRRRRKKCDESSYPSCKNCSSNLLSCKWPESVTEARKKEIASFQSVLNSLNVPHLATGPGISDQHDQQDQPPNGPNESPRILDDEDLLLLRQSETTGDNSSSHATPLLESKGLNYFLQMIAMQQDCVDEEIEPVKTPTPEYKNKIRSRIWNQVEVVDDLELPLLFNASPSIFLTKSPSPISPHH
ncbi:hypothetical protein PUMCH_001258 [Australozyma saopauloensis]|uniref:Zn(2)-C6 fungal-type domain-containing protein n=1 Tax=Australozyma saopauloensis TaxID=291208 RepID=A0AAX4H6A6_9ASCO|nr:hypothetical protein PUMCH_001258 [[Candida] saopauloensis]